MLELAGNSFSDTQSNRGPAKLLRNFSFSSDRPPDPRIKLFFLLDEAQFSRYPIPLRLNV